MILIRIVVRYKSDNPQGDYSPPVTIISSFLSNGNNKSFPNSQTSVAQMHKEQLNLFQKEDCSNDQGWRKQRRSNILNKRIEVPTVFKQSKFEWPQFKNNDLI